MAYCSYCQNTERSRAPTRSVEVETQILSFVAIVYNRERDRDVTRTRQADPFELEVLWPTFQTLDNVKRDVGRAGCRRSNL